MTALRPIEIVGGGLAGLSLGLALRRQGVPTTIYEAGHYPRHRVCGEFITGLDANTTATLGLDDVLRDALRLREVAWHVPGKPAWVEPLPTAALGISRHRLDARLANAFSEAGGALLTEHRVRDPRPRPGCVLATGRRPGRSHWAGLKAHVRGVALAADLELHLGRDAYVGLSRLDGGEVNVCGLFRERVRGEHATSIHDRPLPAPGARVWATLISLMRQAGLDALADRVAVAEVDWPACCSVAALNFQTAPPVRGEVRLGDASVMIPPFTGDGMAMAFQGAATAFPALLRYSDGRAQWEETCATINRTLRRRFRVRLASARLLHPLLLRGTTQHWLRRLSRSGLLPFRPLYHVLH